MSSQDLLLQRQSCSAATPHPQMAVPMGIEPILLGRQPSIMPVDQETVKVGRAGIEPACPDMTVQVLALAWCELCRVSTMQSYITPESTSISMISMCRKQLKYPTLGFVKCNVFRVSMSFTVHEYSCAWIDLHSAAAMCSAP